MEVFEIISQMRDKNQELMTKAVANNKSTYHAGKRLGLGLMIAAVVLAAFSIIVCIFGIIRPIRKSSAELKDIIDGIEAGKGDLTKRIEVKGKDEIAQMVLNTEYEWDYPDADKVGRAKRIFDAPGRYIVYLKKSFPDHLSLNGLRIVLDCANGANYKIAPLALEELGAEVVTMGNEPNGTNINLQCGSLHPEHVADKVREVRADLGLALDGDADRLIVVDETGTILDGDQIMAICAEYLIEHGKLKNNTLAATTMSNMALETFMEERGGTLIRTNVGDRYVVEAMRKFDLSLGGEKSGHLIFHDFSTTGDGLLAALQVLTIMCESGKKLSELAHKLELYPQEMENVSITQKPDLATVPEIQDALKNAENQLGKYGRVLLRYSGTENLCRVMVEARDEKLVKQLVKDLAKVVHSALNK